MYIHIKEYRILIRQTSCKSSSPRKELKIERYY